MLQEYTPEDFDFNLGSTSKNGLVDVMLHDFSVDSKSSLQLVKNETLQKRDENKDSHSHSQCCHSHSHSHNRNAKGNKYTTLQIDTKSETINLNFEDNENDHDLFLKRSPCQRVCDSVSVSVRSRRFRKVGSEEGRCENNLSLEERKKQQAITLLRVVFYFTLLFSFTEIFAGMISHSLLLIEESVHMFADSLSYGINLWAEIKSQASVTDERSRDFAQLVGTFVSLFALSLTLVAVFWESVRRLTTNELLVSVDANIMIGFGIALSAFHLSCLLAYYMGVNILHSHSHGGGHGHSHVHSHPSPDGNNNCHSPDSHEHSETLCNHDQQKSFHDDDQCSGTEHGHDHDHEHANENLWSAIVHVFVDFLHSFIVIITALVVMFTSPEHSARIDAVSSLLLCFVILSGCVVLFKSFWNQLDSYRSKNSSRGEYLESLNATASDHDLAVL